MTTSRSRAEWLDLFHKCQDGDASCMYVLKEMERENVPTSCLVPLSADLLALCRSIETLPASAHQTELSLKAAAVRVELERLINWAATTSI